jgi:hypothetical protein
MSPEVLAQCLPVLFPAIQVLFFRVMCLIAFEAKFIVVLNYASLISCHNFLILFLYFNIRSRPDRSLFISDKLILLDASLHAEAIDAVKLRAALSASSPELMLILGDIEYEVVL